MTPTLQRTLIVAVCEAVIAKADDLTALDQAVGDADHGVNMKRGFGDVLATIDGLTAKPWPDALKAIGTTLVMKVGGASGPLYGTLFLTLAKELPANPSLADLARAFQAACDAVAARGKSTVGQKTMLDVLAPVAAVLSSGGPALPAKARAAAKAAAEATIPMKAERGRASFLGDRSIGHMDPGACSSALMIGVVCDVLEKRTT